MNKKNLRKLLKQGTITEKEYQRRLRILQNKNKNKNSMIDPDKTMVKASRKDRRGGEYIKGPNHVRNVLTTPLLAPPEHLAKYMAMVLNPAGADLVRMPDSSNIRTALYRSIQTLPLMADFGTGASTSSFSFCAQPKLGFSQTSGVINYKTAYTSWPDYTAMDTIEFDDASTYLNDMDGVDPRVDVNSRYLTSGSSGYWSASFSNLASSGAFGGGGAIYYSQYNYGLNVRKVSDVNLAIPTGLFRVTIIQQTSSDSGTENPATPVLSFTGCTVYPELQNITNYFALVESFDANSRTRAWENVIYCSSSAGAINLVSSWDHTFYTYIMISSCVGNHLPSPVNDGIVKKIRPTAMSVLVTYTAPILENGGIIAINQLPGDAIIDNYFNSQGLHYQSWSQLTQVPSTYDGPLSNGCFSFWTPEQDADRELQLPSAANTYSFPSIVCSGVYAPGRVLTGMNTLGRIRIETIFEYTTTNTIMNVDKNPGNRQELDIVNQTVSLARRNHSNPGHLEAIKDFYKRALDAIYRNIPQITTIVGALTRIT